MAARFGWAAVSDRPMTFPQYALARQFVTEETIGTQLRKMKREEDAQFAASVSSMQKRTR